MSFIFFQNRDWLHCLIWLSFMKLPLMLVLLPIRTCPTEDGKHVVEWSKGWVFFSMDCVFHDFTIMFQMLIDIFCACLDRVLRMVRCCSSQSIRTQFSSAGKGLEMQFSFARLAFEWMQYLWQTSSYHWYVIFFWAEFKWALMLILIFLNF